MLTGSAPDRTANEDISSALPQTGIRKVSLLKETDTWSEKDPVVERTSPAVQSGGNSLTGIRHGFMTSVTDRKVRPCSWQIRIRSERPSEGVQRPERVGVRDGNHQGFRHDTTRARAQEPEMPLEHGGSFSWLRGMNPCAYRPLLHLIKSIS